MQLQQGSQTKPLAMARDFLYAEKIAVPLSFLKGNTMMRHRRPLNALCVLLLVALSTATTTAADPIKKYLLLDDRNIDTADNAALAIGTAVKHPRNPLFGEDKPWEQRYDNMYASVIYEEDDRLYRLWYNPFIKDNSAKGMSLAQRRTIPYKPPRRQNGFCYAFSRDGLTWEKPDLGIIEYQGSKANNLVLRGHHGPGIFKDPRDPDPERRYKMFHARDLVRFSPDGFHWSEARKCENINSNGDTHNHMLWVPELERYAVFVRLRDRGQRLVGRAESTSADIGKAGWTRAVEVLRNNRTDQSYAMPVFRHAGIYLGLVAIFRTDEDRVHTELAWSPDTVTWHRIQPGTPFIGNASNEGDYDWGCVYAADDPVILDDEIRIYYLGSNGKHTSWRDGFFCLATLRPDGWAGYEQADAERPAAVTTRVLPYRGGPIQVTADVGKGGALKVSALDEAGKVLSTSVPITQTVTNVPLKWESPVKAGAIRLRFTFNGAKVYGFSLKSAESTKGDGGFISLFDGKTLNGWHAVPEESAGDWSVRDGIIVGHGSAKRLSYLVWKDAGLTDFELKLQYRLPGKGNTGIEIRSQPDATGKRPFQGYHADLGHVGIGPHILGAWDFHFAKRREYPCPRGTDLHIDENGAAHAHPIRNALTLKDIHRGQWNKVRIVARGRRFQFYINGKLASAFTDNAKQGRLDRGAIGLQIHDKGMRVEFKDLQLKRLSPSGGTAKKVTP